MSAPKHTPGPWEVINGLDVFTAQGARNAAGVEADSNDGWQIADCREGITSVGERLLCLRYEEKQANARLIAAAPDMLAALQLINAFMCFEDMGADDPIFAAWGIEDPRGLLGAGKDVLAAIAKAEGRA